MVEAGKKGSRKKMLSGCFGRGWLLYVQPSYSLSLSLSFLFPSFFLFFFSFSSFYLSLLCYLFLLHPLFLTFFPTLQLRFILVSLLLFACLSHGSILSKLRDLERKSKLGTCENRIPIPSIRFSISKRSNLLIYQNHIVQLKTIELVAVNRLKFVRWYITEQNDQYRDQVH